MSTERKSIIEDTNKILSNGYYLSFENPSYVKITKGGKDGELILELTFFRKEGVPIEETSGVILTEDDLDTFDKLKKIYIKDGNLCIVYSDVAGREHIAVNTEGKNWTW